MKKRLFVALAVLAVLTGVLAGAAAAAEEAMAGPVVVTIEGSSFSPETALVKVGGEVVWKNKALQGFLWVHVELPAEEQYSDSIVLKVSEASCC